jgi:hypothetical protein
MKHHDGSFQQVPPSEAPHCSFVPTMKLHVAVPGHAEPSEPPHKTTPGVVVPHWAYAARTLMPLLLATDAL